MILRFNFHIKFRKNSRLDGIDIEVSDQSVFVSKCFRCLFVFSWATMVMFFSPVCTCVQNNDLDLITMAHAVVCFVTDLITMAHAVVCFVTDLITMAHAVVCFVTDLITMACAVVCFVTDLITMAHAVVCFVTDLITMACAVVCFVTDLITMAHAVVCFFTDLITMAHAVVCFVTDLITMAHAVVCFVTACCRVFIKSYTFVLKKINLGDVPYQMSPRRRRCLHTQESFHH